MQQNIWRIQKKRGLSKKKMSIHDKIRFVRISKRDKQVRERETHTQDKIHTHGSTEYILEKRQYNTA